MAHLFSLFAGDRGSCSRRAQQKELRLSLVQAIEKHELSTVQSLLIEGLQLDCIILFNKTPLTYAIEMEAFDIAKTLVSAGADLNASEPIASARQPTHVAVDYGSQDMLGFLLQHGADVDGRDGCGATPLMLASYAGFMDAVEILHRHGADLNAEDAVGRTAVHRAAEGQHDAVVQFLAHNGADISARDHFGWTALYHSIIFAHVDTIKLLISCGISVNTLDKNHRSPVAVTCNRLCPPNIRIVLSTSLDYHKRERKIPTSALHLVLNSEDCTKREFTILQLLVNAGAQLNVTRLTRFFQLCPTLALKSKEVLLHFLFLCGCVWNQEDLDVAASAPYVPQLQCWLMEERSLQQMCRVAVRSHLSKRCQSRDIDCAIGLLPVPQALKNYLSLLDIADKYPAFGSHFSAPPGLAASTSSI